MTRGAGRYLGGSNLVAREHPLIGLPDKVKKEPETVHGRDLEKMMEGDEEFLRAVCLARGHGEASRPGDWPGKKMIIGAGTEEDGKPYKQALSVSNVGAKGRVYVPSIYKIVHVDGMWKASYKRTTIGWEEQESDIHDHRVKLAYWNEAVGSYGDETMPAYEDVGLTKPEALRCYKNWLLRLYGHMFPTALLGAKLMRTNPTPGLVAQPPRNKQKKRKNVTAAPTAGNSKKKAKTSTRRATIHSETPDTEEDWSAALAGVGDQFGNRRALRSDVRRQQPEFDARDDVANAEYDDDDSLSDFRDDAPSSDVDDEEPWFAQDLFEQAVQAKPELASEEEPEEQIEDAQAPNQEIPDVPGDNKDNEHVNEGVVEDPRDEINAQFRLSTDLEWWDAFNNRMWRVDANALSIAEVCNKIGNDWLQARGLDSNKYDPPSPQILRVAHSEAVNQGVAILEDTTTLKEWVRFEGRMSQWLT